ncbi:MAG: tetratricopeptide repeat protein [Verrucomicrobiota bacterium]
MLATQYFVGTNVPHDFVEAARLLRLAAEQGNAIGQYSLGMLYATGKGVTQDFAEAASWNGKAADQGDKRAQKIQASLLAMAQKQRPSPPAQSTVQAQPQPTRSPRELSPAEKWKKNLLTVGMVAAVIVLLILTNGNVLLFALAAIPLLIVATLVWAAGGAVAESLWGCRVGAKEIAIGVCIVVVGLFVLGKGCANATQNAIPEDDDPASHGWNRL